MILGGSRVGVHFGRDVVLVRIQIIVFEQLYMLLSHEVHYV